MTHRGVLVAFGVRPRATFVPRRYAGRNPNPRGQTRQRSGIDSGSYGRGRMAQCAHHINETKEQTMSTTQIVIKPAGIVVASGLKAGPTPKSKRIIVLDSS